jgi:hypothetical protein
VKRTSASQRASIRAEVERSGGCIVQPTEMSLLCADELSVAEQFDCIAAIAREEGWSFAFLPDGAVEFANFAAV